MRARIIPLIFTVGLLLSSCKEDAGYSDSEGQNVSNDKTHLSFQMIELKRKGGNKCLESEPETTDTTGDDALCASITLTYPKMSSDVIPELAVKLNALILRQLVDKSSEEETSTTLLPLETFANNFIDEFKEEPSPFNNWELERSISVAFSTKKILTLSFEEYGYTGGAHPFSSQQYSVLSLEDGEPVLLADLLAPGYEPPLTVMGEKAFRKARELDDADTLEEQGFSFDNNVFRLNENYGVVKEGLDFIFNSYEIAPYAMGPTQFTIPYEDIHSLIRPTGLLGSTDK